MSQSYYSSTDPQSSPGTSGVRTYTNHNAINSKAFKSTEIQEFYGTHNVNGTISLTGTFSLTNNVSAVAGSTTLATTYDLNKTSYQSITSTSGALKKYLLDSPSEGSVKTLLVSAGGAGDVYVYASASSAYTAYFGANTSQNIMKFTTPDSLIVELLGLSTSKWAISNLSTINNGTTGSLSLASSNS